MDIGTLVGILAGFGLVIGAILMGGSGARGFFDIPSVVIVGGGTVAVTFIMFPLGVVLGTFKVAMKAFFASPPNPVEKIRQIVSLADTARKESLVALEKANVSDPFMSRGILLVADGTEEGLVRAVLENEVNAMRKRHSQGQGVFKQMGTMAPAFGMIGTLVGLVQMLQNLSDPSSIGPAMAVALLTTLYGALLANIVFLPLAVKLAERSSEEADVMELSTEGIIAILNGEHPNIIKEKLNSFLPPSQREGGGK